MERAVVVRKAAKDTNIPIRVQWEPYFLNKNTPPGGEDLMEHLAQKYGNDAVARFSRPGNPLDVAGEKVGIKFNKSRRIIPTQACHRIMEYLNQNHPNKSDQFMNILFQKYFEDGLDVSRDDVLIQSASEIGISDADTHMALQSNELLADVMKKVDHAQRALHVRGVPHFFVSSNNGGRPIDFSGAQPPDIIAEALQMAYRT
eukprot:gene8876-18375_t